MLQDRSFAVATMTAALAAVVAMFVCGCRQDAQLSSSAPASQPVATRTATQNPDETIAVRATLEESSIVEHGVIGGENTASQPANDLVEIHARLTVYNRADTSPGLTMDGEEIPAPDPRKCWDHVELVVLAPDEFASLTLKMEVKSLRKPAELPDLSPKSVDERFAMRISREYLRRAERAADHSVTIVDADELHGLRKLAPLKIAKVSSLAELRALEPVAKDNDWELRVALADDGVEGAPWKLLYAHCKYVGQQSPSREPPGWGRSDMERLVGPVGWEVQYAKPGRQFLDMSICIDRSETLRILRDPRELVYRAVVPTPLAGRYRIRAGGRRGASAIIEVKDAPELGWFALFEPPKVLKKRKLGEPVAAAMIDSSVPVAPAGDDGPVFGLTGSTKLRPGEAKEVEKDLPGRHPGRSVYASYDRVGAMLVEGGSRKAFEMEATVEGGKLKVRCRGFRPQESDRVFLVRWRLNGKVLAAPRPADPQRRVAEEVGKSLDEMSDQVYTIESDLVLPRWVAAKAKPGNKLSMELLYNPQGFEPITDPQRRLARLRDRRNHAQPVLAKPVEFVLTREIIERVKKEKP